MIWWRNAKLSWISLLLILNSILAHESAKGQKGKSKANKDHIKANVYCRDHNGEAVDWWILLKVSGPSGQYVLYTSKDAKKERTIGSQTVYGSIGERPDIPSKVDNRMFMAWNDQQPRPSQTADGSPDDAPEDDEMDEVLERAAEDAEAQNGADNNSKGKKKNTKKNGHGKDMYGQGESVESAHSKGMVGLAVVDSEGRFCDPDEYDSKKEYHVEGFFINHSFPRTPDAEFDEKAEGGLVYRRKLPEQKNFFGSNIRNPQAKGQHAVCLSFTQEVDISNKKKQIIYDRSKVDRATMNLFSLLEGLDTIGPSMVMTTYVPWHLQHRIWHQLFNVRSVFSETILTEALRIKNTNIARVKSDIPPNFSDHAFPLWASTNSVRISPTGNKKYFNRTAISLRSPAQMSLTRCPEWCPEGNRNRYLGCFTSIILTTTKRQYQISPAIDFKHPMFIADVDDIIGARMVPPSDMSNASINPAPDRPHYVALMVVTQSWIDFGTFGSSARYLVDTPALKVKAWFHNNYISHLPCATNGVRAQPSSGTDHSKWFIASYLYGQKGSFVPLAGFMDLNRNSKATRLPNRNYGRGGMFIFFNDPMIVSFMMKLNPVVADNSGRTLLSTSLISMNHMPQSLKMATVTQFNNRGSGIAVQFDGEKTFKVFHIPYIDVPQEIRNVYTQKTGNVFLLGSHEAESGLYTPPRMKSQPTGRKKDEFDRDEVMESAFAPAKQYRSFSDDDFNADDISLLSDGESSDSSESDSESSADDDSYNDVLGELEKFGFKHGKALPQPIKITTRNVFKHPFSGESDEEMWSKKSSLVPTDDPESDSESDDEDEALVRKSSKYEKVKFKKSSKASTEESDDSFVPQKSSRDSEKKKSSNFAGYRSKVPDLDDSDGDDEFLENSIPLNIPKILEKESGHDAGKHFVSKKRK